MLPQGGDAEVLIVGAGPAGLVAALALLQNGVSVRIIDKNEYFNTNQKGVAITPRSIELYRFLGIWPDMEKLVGPAPLMQNYELQGGTEVLKRWEFAPYTKPTPDFPYLNYVVLAQNRSEEILRSHLLRHSCQVETGTKLVSFEQQSDHVVACLVKGSDEGHAEETARFSWLIGTDGARGIIRKQLGLSFLGETRDAEPLVVGDVCIKGLSKDAWHMWGNLAFNGVSFRPSEDKDDDLFAIFMGGKDIDFAKMVSNREELIKRIHELTGRSDFEFGKMSGITEYKPNIRMVNKFSEGRVFVAGGPCYNLVKNTEEFGSKIMLPDAAHVHSITGGQGMNSSIQDSLNLAWKLALVQKGLAEPSLLLTYTEERIPIIAEMLDKTTLLLDKTLKAKSKDDQSGWSRVDEQVTRNAEPGDDKKIVVAGGRAPDAPGLISADPKSTKTNMFDLFGLTHHTVLIFSPSIDQAASIHAHLKRYPDGALRVVIILPAGVSPTSGSSNADFVLEDGEGYAYSNYATQKEDVTVVVVRPDAYIGAAVRGVEGLTKYFGTIFSV